MSTATATRPTDQTGGRRRTNRWLLYALLVILTLIFISPLLYMLSTSFKTTAGAAAPAPQWIPVEPTTQAYESILTTSGTPVLRWLLNSVVAAAAQTLLILVTASMAGYALARIDFKGKRIIFALIIATLFVPPVILLIPNYLVVGRLGWLDTLLAVILPGAAGAFGVFFLRQFFLGLPVELEEAARIDGASRWRTFRQIILPLSRPALVTLALLSFLTNWNDFLWPVYVLFSPENQTLPAGLSTLQNANAVRYDLLMAGAVIASAPVLLLYFLAQRYIVEGVGRAGLKG
ncbi:carbohydrate ABC transporter permease [Georgenia sp. AZ-5]|uniref:carbohydrate ABC transporter permease n=1 Tax=Georgenia sp. AZ-5 TaxID=3367526 RepID=UPI00375435A3